MAEGALEIPKYSCCIVSAANPRPVDNVWQSYPCVGLLRDVDHVRGGGAGELLGVPEVWLV
jgi:hypothetical protein